MGTIRHNGFFLQRKFQRRCQKQSLYPRQRHIERGCIWRYVGNFGGRGDDYDGALNLGEGDCGGRDRIDGEVEVDGRVFPD